MTVIRASCPVCGDVELTASMIRCTDGPGGLYRFRCPLCADTVVKPADSGVQALLRTGGVLIEHVPAEVWELHVGPRISPDDYLDAALLLGREETDVLAVLYRETVKGEMA